MEKVWKVVMIFVVAMVLGMILPLASVSGDICEYFCPRNYPPSEGSQCTKCCDEKCPTEKEKVRCYLNCSVKVEG